MRAVVRTLLAERDIRDILDYLSERSEAAATRLATELAARVRMLAGQPRGGRPRDELGPGIRSTVVGRYLVFFRATADELVVVRVIHGSRDVERAFREPE